VKAQEKMWFMGGGDPEFIVRMPHPPKFEDCSNEDFYRAKLFEYLVYQITTYPETNVLLC
jgi:hypothetical protein